MATPTPADVAAWMLSELEKRKILYQDEAAGEIQMRYGNAFVYDNENGNLAIQPAVLAAFNKVSHGVIWSRSQRYWRPREKGDDPGRMQP